MRVSRRNIAYMISLLFGICCSNTYSQEFLEEFSCANVNTNNCGGVLSCPRWFISHGSPRIASGAAFMENPNTFSEGIFADYPFKAGESYEIEFRAHARNQLQFLMVRAAVGLVHAPHLPGDNCSDPVPAASPAPVIIRQQLSGAWSTHVIPFNPVLNYDQIWLYADRGDIWVDYIQIKRVCTPNKTFSNWDVVPNGLTEVEDFIWAGSKQNGSTSGLVTSGVNNQTELKAGDHILFSEDFQSCPSASGYMVAGIADCGQNFSFKKENGSISIREPIHNESIEKLTVLQNLSTGHPTLKLKLEMERDVGVMVINEIGQVMYSADGARMPPGENEITLPTHQLKSGLYVAIVTVDEENLTRKFIIP